LLEINELNNSSFIESLYFDYKSKAFGKCFTFFNALDKHWRDFTLNLITILFKVNVLNMRKVQGNGLDFKTDDDSYYSFLIIHSSKNLPQFVHDENFIYLHNFSSYYLTYKVRWFWENWKISK
jgi:hypothetical protein